MTTKDKRFVGAATTRRPLYVTTLEEVGNKVGPCNQALERLPKTRLKSLRVRLGGDQ